MTLDESAFHAIADRTLTHLLERLEDDLGDHLDADIQGGVLTIDLDDGGQYVINKHAPNRQLWVSSPVSGALHFNFDAAAEQWVATRSDARLYELLSGELSAATGTAFRLP
jgi:frataxin